MLQKLYTSIQDSHYLHDLCSQLPSTSLRSELLKHFKNTELVTNIYNAISRDAGNEQRAAEYFYDASRQSKKNIQDFIYGFVKMALECDKLVVLCFDELQFLIDIDPTRALVKVFLEQFIRKIMEECRDKRLYILVSCLQNPDKKEYDVLRSISKNFDTIIAGKEIILGQLMPAEQDEIVNQVIEKVRMADDEKRKFKSQIKSKLGFYSPRMLLSEIASILDTMGYTAYSIEELRGLYEKEAREFITPKLREAGFTFVDAGPTERGGFNFDIHASF
nr:hypothetical protein [Candidatus Sigynarchaeota archaeon]